MIDVNIETIKPAGGSGTDVSVIKLIGEVDATNAVIVQQKVMPLLTDITWFASRPKYAGSSAMYLR